MRFFYSSSRSAVYSSVHDKGAAFRVEAERQSGHGEPKYSTAVQWSALQQY